MGSISTLVPDIQNLLKTKGWFSDDIKNSFVSRVGDSLQEQFNRTERKPSLRMSQLGPKCPRHLWYSIHKPELGEPFPASAMLKFSYGHVIEAMLIGLIKASGHSVTGEQDELSVDGITGHRDCVVDGAIFDIKSSSSRGFTKFKDKSLAEADDFGYLEQLDAYGVGSFDDPLVTVKDKAYILAMDKTLGHLVVYEHRIRERHIRQRIQQYKEIVALPSPPRCQCAIVPDGESGNLRLDVAASYSSFKHCCHPQLRTFLYSSGPKHFTKVVKVPTYKGFTLVELTRQPQADLTKTFH